MKAPTVEHVALVLANPWVRSGIAITIAIVVWRLLDAFITRFYARRFISRFIPRVPTYASLTKSISGVVIFFFLVLELLNIWDVNVEPALWSAGALSVVIGIGAQAIVRDVLTGTFYLFEDTFDVGDGVELITGPGPINGIVESVGMREVRIIDGQGNIVSVPYGSIVYVSNTTRLPSRIVFTITVPLRASVGMLRERITDIATTAARSGEVQVDNIAVQLKDVTIDSATFAISFHVTRPYAMNAEPFVRESIVTALQAEGVLPGGPSGAAGGRAVSNASGDRA